jgi:hypothetical protein
MLPLGVAAVFVLGVEGEVVGLLRLGLRVNLAPLLATLRLGAPAALAYSDSHRKKRRCFEEREETIRLPWRGQCGRAAAARALCACCAAGYAKDCTGSPVRFWAELEIGQVM